MKRLAHMVAQLCVVGVCRPLRELPQKKVAQKGMVLQRGV
jgi:hypothetical protein